MHRGWLAVVAWYGAGCVDHHCDEGVGGPPTVHADVAVTVPGGTTSIPPVAVKIGGWRVTDGYWVEGTSGEDSGTCAVTTERVKGLATVSADGGPPVSLPFIGEDYSGTMPYASTYALALHETSGDDYLATVDMPMPFAITLTVDPATVAFANTTGAIIPDAQPAGVAINIPVAGVHRATGLTVAVDITHTARGDLELDLLKDNTLVKTLFMNQDGLADNLNQTFTLTSAEIGTDVNATWTLRVIDSKPLDTGRVNTVSLTFTQMTDVHIETPPATHGEDVSLEIFDCTARFLSSAGTPGPTWTLSAYGLRPTSNYRFTVTRALYSQPLASASFATYVDFGPSNGSSCEL